MYSPSRRAFTLIELLVVIAIIAVLAVIVVLVLNPAQLLQQSRDANRLSDIATMNNAANIYNTDQIGASSFSLGSSSVTYVSIPDPTATSSAGTNCSGLGGNFATGTTFFHCPASSTYRNVNGTGWIPINFTNISSGAPLGALPMDPINSTATNDYYTYQTNGSTYKVVGIPEANKNVMAMGQNPLILTAGSNPTLDGGFWVLVPGNSTFGTNNFYVMKYDAGCAGISTGAALTTPITQGGYNDSSSSGTNCTSVNGLAPLSSSERHPRCHCLPAKRHLLLLFHWCPSHDEQRVADHRLER